MKTNKARALIKNNNFSFKTPLFGYTWTKQPFLKIIAILKYLIQMTKFFVMKILYSKTMVN